MALDSKTSHGYRLSRSCSRLENTATMLQLIHSLHKTKLSMHTEESPKNTHTTDVHQLRCHQKLLLNRIPGHLISVSRPTQIIRTAWVYKCLAEKAIQPTEPKHIFADGETSKVKKNDNIHNLPSRLDGLLRDVCRDFEAASGSFPPPLPPNLPGSGEARCGEAVRVAAVPIGAARTAIGLCDADGLLAGSVVALL